MGETTNNTFQRERHSPDVREAVEQIVGPKPKQPLPVYFRFMQQIRPSIVADNPHLTKKELQTVITERWNSMDAQEKEILRSDFRHDMREYSKKIIAYNRTINLDATTKITDKLSEINTSNSMSELELIKSRNKPKKPQCSFLRFLHAQNDRQSNEKNQEYMKRMTIRWQALSQTEKIEYKTKPEEMDAYKNAMQKWNQTFEKLKKPEKPQSSFLRFLHEQNDRQSNEKYQEYLKRMSIRWQALSQAEKMEYTTNPEEMEAYKKAVHSWNEKQLKESQGKSIETVRRITGAGGNSVDMLKFTRTVHLDYGDYEDTIVGDKCDDEEDEYDEKEGFLK